jgi:putative DNA-invertase from lambdoid prophage Rac
MLPGPGAGPFCMWNGHNTPSKVIKRTIVVILSKNILMMLSDLLLRLCQKNDRFLALLNRTLSHCWKNSLGFLVGHPNVGLVFWQRPNGEITMATFAYGRVSTTQQDTENQRLELEQAGGQIDYWFADIVSGKVPAMQRKAFSEMLSKIRDGETLVVAKLDRLGRDAIDVLQTVRALGERNIKVIVHQLGTTDRTSTAGKLLLSMLAAVAEMERDLLIKRTQAGLSRAKVEGKKLGRPSKIAPEARKAIIEKKNSGTSISALAREYGVSRATIAALL